MPQRIEQLKHWLDSLPGLQGYQFEPASGDASFRRYFRISVSDGSYIAMDAPPEREKVLPFVNVAQAFEAIGLNVPHIHAGDYEQGFLLLDDLGEPLYLDRLNTETVERLYGDALGALVTLQACGPREGLPDYDRELLQQEMGLFRDWLLVSQLQLALSDAEEALLEKVFGQLTECALEQPRVCVHRDYHSRNLIVSSRQNPGILDFQDAVIGPVTYDLVSLLRDCYIAWPQSQVEAWAMGYFELACQSGVLRAEDESRFMPWFDLMGIQRHLKASGIFARLNLRDGKPGYLKDIPRTLEYVLQAATRHTDLDGFVNFLQSRVMPLLDEKFFA
ncbi:MAG: phosphotransferase [Candidatus Thiodiazotropha sp.]